MKKTILLFVAIVSIAVQTFAQAGPNAGLSSNLIVFSEDGQKFYLILNGIRQNNTPETNVKVTNLTMPYYSTKIIFEDQSIPMIEKKMVYVQDDRGQPLEMNYHIVNTKDGTRALRMYVQMPMTLAPPSDPSVRVITYNTVAMPPIASTTTTTTTTTTTAGTMNNNTTGANVNVNVGGIGIGMDVNINDPYMTGNTTATTTYSTTTTTTSSNSGTGVGMSTTTDYFLSGYNGPEGCQAWPMKDADFASAKASISSKSFEDSKLTTAKQVANSNCLTSEQVRQIMKLFSFESSKLDFAKYAYAHTFDLGNYFKVNDAFEFESSIEDLNESIGK